MNWTNAKDYCEEKGALLLKIEDASEREWVRNTHTNISLKTSIRSFSYNFISFLAIRYRYG